MFKDILDFPSYIVAEKYKDILLTHLAATDIIEMVYRTTWIYGKANQVKFILKQMYNVKNVLFNIYV